MTIEEIVKKYKIAEVFDNNKKDWAGILRINSGDLAKKDNMVDEIKNRKPEILKYLKDERDAAKRKAEERQEKINSIEGLAEIRENNRRVNNWHYEFNKAMESEDEAYLLWKLGPCPEDKTNELLEKYPRAAAYLKADREANKSNYELSAIGTRARERIIEGENYKIVMSDMEKELNEFFDRHFWD